MEGDSRNPSVSLLKKYDIPIDHLSYEYVETCEDKKELERIVRILRSGQEGMYPDLLKKAESKLSQISPNSRVLRVETPALTKGSFTDEEWKTLEEELLSWENEMNVMDKGLEYEKRILDIVGNKNIPEVRKVVDNKNEEKLVKKDVCKKVKVEVNSKNNRIKSGDYDAWDKFDVEKELLKLDLEEERKDEKNAKIKREIEKRNEQEKKIEQVNINVDNDAYSDVERQVLADRAKDKGNEFFKSGDYAAALKYYNISLTLCETVNAYNNRAMTYLKLKNYESALKDCNEVLKREQNNVKALHRRSSAYQNIEGDHNKQLAYKDLLKIVELEPNNRVAQADLQSLKKKLNVQNFGRKFRMMIEESSSNNSTQQINNDNDLTAVGKLPLTYYGPSTSTFKCEPQSLTHRMFSDPTQFGGILCKCNNNAPRQNPLCHRCGEIMSRPSQKPKPKPETTTTIKVENKSDISLAQGDNKEVKSKSLRNEQNEKSKLASSEVRTDADAKENDAKIEELENMISELKICDGNNISEKEVKTGINLNMDKKEKKNIDNEYCKEAGAMESNKEESDVNNDNSVKDNQCLPNNFSQSEVKTECKKNRNKKKKKKKKSKDDEPQYPEFAERNKIVQSAKYLQKHPTSVEPKPDVNKTPSECLPNNSQETTIQFKNFVPDKKSVSVENGVLNESVASFCSYNKDNDVKVYTGNDITRLCEGNKENILENVNNFNGIESEIIPFSGSSFEFMKMWESMKKTDESYEKRADIIRLICPKDLKKIVGSNLDHSMLKSLLECLEKHFLDDDPKKVISILKELPHIPRFNLVNMFLNPSERNVLERLIESTEKRGFELDEESKKSLKCSF